MRKFIVTAIQECLNENLSPLLLTQKQMLQLGASGSLSKAFERYIPINKIKGLDPSPIDWTDDNGTVQKYQKGNTITKSIEVIYNKNEDIYYLQNGNHRLKQAIINGETYIRAFVQPDKGQIGHTKLYNEEKFIREILKEHLNEQVDNNVYIFHGTGKGQALNIQRDGYMKPNKTGEKHPSISFTNDLDYAKYYAKAKGGISKMCILRTKIDDNFQLSPRIKNNKGDEYITFNIVPSSKIELMTLNSGWQPLDTWNIIFDEPLNS